MKSCGDSNDPSIHYYCKRLEAVRKDIERAFGILQARFAFLKDLAFFGRCTKYAKQLNLA